jgi:hypothetical protein
VLQPVAKSVANCCNLLHFVAEILLVTTIRKRETSGISKNAGNLKGAKGNLAHELPNLSYHFESGRPEVNFPIADNPGVSQSQTL